MPILRILQTTAAQWSVSDDLPGLLHPAGAVGPARQAASRSHAGSHRPMRGQPIETAGAGQCGRPHGAGRLMAGSEA